LVNYYLGFPIPPRHAVNSGQPQLLSHA